MEILLKSLAERAVKKQTIESIQAAMTITSSNLADEHFENEVKRLALIYGDDAVGDAICDAYIELEDWEDEQWDALYQ
jgi:hypothetical protein